MWNTMWNPNTGNWHQYNPASIQSDYQNLNRIYGMGPSYYCAMSPLSQQYQQQYQPMQYQYRYSKPQHLENNTNSSGQPQQHNNLNTWYNLGGEGNLTHAEKSMQKSQQNYLSRVRL